MLTFLIRASIKLLVLSGFLYTVFFVRLGKHTTYEHVQRIAKTSEAHEFGSELGEIVGQAKAKALEHIGNPASLHAGK